MATSSKENENDPLLEALNAIQGTGRFHSSGTAPFIFPGINLENGEEIAFPLPVAQVEMIKSQAEADPFGKGKETLLDETVRRCWQIDLADMKLSQDWNKALANIIARVTDDLGVEGKVIATPYKLLIYEEGGFFLSHRDTEKLTSMFGSLIIALPSAHQGGELVIRHRGEEALVDFSCKRKMHQIQFAAFFADCEHEVKSVTSGNRLCLTYNLTLKKADPSALNLSVNDHAATLVSGLRQLWQSAGARATAILLDHRYTEATLSVSGLKNHDRARAAALFAAADEVGFVAHLALVSLYQLGEPDWELYEHRTSLSEEMMGNVIEESLTINHWRNQNDMRVALGELCISETEIISDFPMDDDDPDEQEADDDYTGNAAPTLEYWYHRAAIVLWPKNAHEDVCSRIVK